MPSSRCPRPRVNGEPCCSRFTRGPCGDTQVLVETSHLRQLTHAGCHVTAFVLVVHSFVFLDAGLGDVLDIAHTQSLTDG